jgi:RNA polymerase-binding transcription factor DksA
VPDAADQSVEIEERARAEFEEAQRLRRIAESMRGYDPTRPVNCLECGEDVPEERLKAQPHTRRCALCAADVERAYREGAPA